MRRAAINSDRERETLRESDTRCELRASDVGNGRTYHECCSEPTRKSCSVLMPVTIESSEDRGEEGNERKI